MPWSRRQADIVTVFEDKEEYNKAISKQVLHVEGLDKEEKV
jgi:hypothetical protein